MKVIVAPFKPFAGAPCRGSKKGFKKDLKKDLIKGVVDMWKKQVFTHIPDKP